MTEANTMLSALWESDGDEAAVVADLDSGKLTLTGNFKGREHEVVADYEAAA